MGHAEMDVTEASPVEAIERVLQEATTVLRPSDNQQGSFLLGYNVDAARPDHLVQDAIREIRILAAEHRSLVIACEVSGFHGTDSGYRLWGIIECVMTESRGGESTRVDGVEPYFKG